MAMQAICLALLCALAPHLRAQGATSADLARAKQRVPKDGWRGHDFASMSSSLNHQMKRAGFAVRDCSLWTVAELQGLQRRLFSQADPDLLAVYHGSSDPRRPRFASLADLESHWSQLAGAPVEMEAVRRDGMCHEAVMWWVHHLPLLAQRQLASEGVWVPSLPACKHPEPAATDAAAKSVHREYTQQVSCQQCHTGKITLPEWQNASLPAPLPVDTAHPGRERQRACDFQNKPGCGPCEGLGGRRWGDGPEQFLPMPCKVISGPGIPASTKGRYPPLATARITGDNRDPIEVRPSVPGKYRPLSAIISLGWKGGVMRMRYDFEGLGSQVYMQTLRQAREGEPGATISTGGSECSCDSSIAGVMHAQAFDPEDPLDPLRLPGSQGGAAYLGRVQVALDGDSPQTNGTVAIADHFMKWAFHFLVDANETSPSFGLPLRLYGPTGVRMVYDSWKLGDPSTSRPGIWSLPPGCNVTYPVCRDFAGAEASPQMVV